MVKLGKLWAGRIFGTNTGNLFIELSSSENNVTGMVRLMDSEFGLSTWRVEGTFDGTLRLHGEPAETPPGVTTGNIEITGTLTPEGRLRGEWSSSLGTAGTFEAFPHDPSSPDQKPSSGESIPEQLFTSNVSLGALRLYEKDLSDLIQFIRKDFVVGRPVITYAIRGNEVSRYFEDFQKDAPSIGELRRIKLTLQEPEAHGINKVVVVDLNSIGHNEIRVQGISESWVTGKAEAIARMLRPFEKALVTTYKKFGLTLNQIIFLAMLILIPAIGSLWQRAAFVGIVVTLLGFLYWLHSKFILNAVIYLGPEEPTALKRLWPFILSWLGAATASLTAAYAFYLLTRNVV